MGLCGAKNRSGSPCKRHAAPGSSRCNLHGGKSTGAPGGNTNAAKPGSLYSRFLTAEEQGIASNLELGSIDEELRLTRIRLMRALEREQIHANKPELEEVTEREIVGNEGSARDEKSRVRDYSKLIDTLTARIQSLEKQRLELLLMQQEIAEKAGGGANGQTVTGFEAVPYDEEQCNPPV